MTCWVLRYGDIMIFGRNKDSIGFNVAQQLHLMVLDLIIRYVKNTTIFCICLSSDSIFGPWRELSFNRDLVLLGKELAWLQMLLDFCICLSFETVLERIDPFNEKRHYCFVCVYQILKFWRQSALFNYKR